MVPISATTPVNHVIGNALPATAQPPAASLASQDNTSLVKTVTAVLVTALIAPTLLGASPATTDLFLLLTVLTQENAEDVPCRAQAVTLSI
jgi:hypothetical protein